MKAIVSKTQLASLIKKIQGAIPSKPSIPVLVNVLLEAIDDQLILSATDLSLSIRAFIDAEVLEEGSIALPAKRFFPLVQELTAPIIEITTSEETATIKAGSSKFKIQGISKDQFPEISELKESSDLTFPTLLLKELLSKTSFAAGKDETRPVLSSVLLQNLGPQTTLTGTDGKRLSKTHAEIPSAENAQGSFILPIKTVEEMIRLLDSKEEETITLRLTSEKIALQVGPVTLVSKLLAGQYPDVSKIIPTEKRNPIQLHREELISLLRQVALFTNEEKSSVRFTFSSGSLNLSVTGNSTGEGSVSMPVNYQGEPVDIAFNPNYFLDILRHSQDETITFDVVDSYNPGLVTDSSKALFVLMPMRLGT